MSALRATIESIDHVVGALTRTQRAEGDDGVLVDIGDFAVPAEAALLLERIAYAARADTMIEIGVASALSTLSICRGRLKAGPLRARSFHVMDPYLSRVANIGVHAIERAGVEPLIVLHPVPAHVALPRLLETRTRVQFAFIDGMHQLDYVLLELFYLDQMLDLGGVIAIHDMWMPGLQHCVSYWLANRAYRPVTIHGDAMTDQACESDHRGCGAPERQPPYFRRNIEAFVDRSVLLVQKMDHDSRQWNFFADYVAAGAGSGVFSVSWASGR